MSAVTVFNSRSSFFQIFLTVLAWKLFCLLKISLFHSNLKALLTAKKNEIMIIIMTIKFMTCPYCYLITIWTSHLYPWKSNERLEETNSKWLFMYPCVFWSQSLAIKFAVVMTILRPSLYNRNIILLEKKRKKKKLSKKMAFKRY